MSSLAATQADGYYLPPELHGRRRQRQKQQSSSSSSSHTKSTNHQSNNNGNNNNSSNTITVRFELPYNGFCEHCGTMVGVGTRFNAAKETTKDYYLSTPIYEFRMKCRHCAAMEFCIRTNPQQRGFDYVSGIYKKKEEGEQQQDDHDVTISEVNMSASGAMATLATPFSHLESLASGKRKVETERDILEGLIHKNRALHQDDALQNARLRTSFRTDRNAKRKRMAEASKLGWGSTSGGRQQQMEVLSSESMSDIVQAKSTTFSNGRRTERQKFRALNIKSMFGKQNETKKIQIVTGQTGAVAIKQEGEGAEVTPQSATTDIPDRVVSSRKTSNVSSLDKVPATTTTTKKRRLLVVPTVQRGKESFTLLVTVSPPSPSTLNDMLAPYSSNDEEE